MPAPLVAMPTMLPALVACTDSAARPCRMHLNLFKHVAHYAEAMLRKRSHEKQSSRWPWALDKKGA